jgi:hypothetical protein
MSRHRSQHKAIVAADALLAPLPRLNQCKAYDDESQT